MIERLVLGWGLVLLRTASFIAIAPPWGVRGVPATIKIGLAAALTLVWGPSQVAVATPVVSSALQSSDSWFAIGWLAAREVLVGGGLGWVLSLALAALKIAGAFIAQEMGLTLAALASPMDQQSSTIVAQILETIGLLLFLAVGAHHTVLRVFHVTLDVSPIGADLQVPPLGWLITLLSRVEILGLELAMPVAVGLLLVTVLLMVLMRWAPQFNLLSFGAPVRLLAGLGLAALLLPDIINRMLLELQRWSLI